MKVAIRVDASIIIGTGHVMRCLTLADALKKQGAEVEFICRLHEGHLLERIEKQGFKIYVLPKKNNPVDIAQRSQENGSFNLRNTILSDEDEPLEKETVYGARWLGCTQQQDADQCKPILEVIKPDWLIVDHYAIDQTWQLLLKESYKKLMVIDDLANRKHQCELLLDQTYGRKAVDYAVFVPKKCKKLLGSQYALLRPEFARWRKYSLKRRAKSEFKKLLITMGGVDPDNVTGQVLDTLKTCNLPKDIDITVVMGATAPYLSKVERQAETMPYRTQVKVNVSNMAEIMANADLAIGAAGATTWERCCLGLPSILLVLADNQKKIAELINEAGAAISLKAEQLSEVCKQINKMPGKFESLVANSKMVTNGSGVNKTLKYLK